MTGPLATGRAHLLALERAIRGLEAELPRVDRWARALARVLPGGGRLLAAGNGGSAAHAQHLTSELVGRFRDDRPPYSAIALHGDTSALTAIVNDYGPEAAFARQVEAHGRAGDVVVLFSTSGRSPNVLAAAATARALGLSTWAITGPEPNPLAAACDDQLCVNASATATIQEVHQVVVHLLCAAFEVVTGVAPAASPATSPDTSPAAALHEGTAEAVPVGKEPG